MSAGPFKAAQLALLPQVLDDERYLVGLSLRQMTVQGAQLVGFASGGLLLGTVEPHVALAANAGTFLLSALVIRLGVRPRPAAATGPTPDAAPTGDESSTGSRQVLCVAALVGIAGLFVVPEGVAAPYGAAIGAGAFGLGLLLAADPLGSVIGAWLQARTRQRPSRRSAVLLAMGAGVPLLFCALGPGLPLSVGLWAVSGAFSTAYLIQTQAIVAELVPDRHRGRVMGRIATVLYTTQGVAIVAGGLAAQATGPFRAVAGAGLLGIVLALCVGVWWRRVARPRRDLVAGSERGSTAHTVSQYSLFRIKDTSLRTDRTSEHKTADQYSLLAMKGTSSSTNGENNEAKPGQYSLFRIKDTSLRTDSPAHRMGAAQYSLLRMEDTSSPLNRIADHVIRTVAELLLLPLNRRLGTRAPSLWGWALCTGVGQPTTERTTTP
jgi:hypothetical protein